MTDRLDPWNRTGSSEIGSHVYENVAYGQRDKSVRKDGLFNKWYWNNGAAAWKNKLGSISHFLYQDKFQWTRIFNVKITL